MRILLSFLFVGCSTLLIGQHALPIQMDTNELNAEIVGYGIIDYSGTSIQNVMSRQLLYGGFIENDVKLASMEKHRGQNKYGIEVNSEVEYRNYQGLGNLLKGNYGFYVRAGFGGYGSTSYTDDLFGLTFFGNQRYLGDTARFSGSEMNGVIFQKIGLGLISKNMKTNFGINYYNISEFAEAFVRKGELIADSSGSNLELMLDARYRYADGAQFNKGWGVGFDLDYRFQTQWIKDKTAYFQAQFKNFGVMHIYNVTEYAVDSTYQYNGVEFNQLYGENALSLGNNDEILDSLGVKQNRKSVTTILPGFVQIGKIVDHLSQEKFQSFFGVRLYTSLAYNPLVYGGGEYKVYSWMKVGLQAIYGGFSSFRIGFYTNYTYKNFNLGIGSENIIGALSHKGNGESINVRLALRW